MDYYLLPPQEKKKRRDAVPILPANVITAIGTLW